MLPFQTKRNTNPLKRARALVNSLFLLAPESKKSILAYIESISIERKANDVEIKNKNIALEFLIHQLEFLKFHQKHNLKFYKEFVKTIDFKALLTPNTLFRVERLSIATVDMRKQRLYSTKLTKDSKVQNSNNEFLQLLAYFFCYIGVTPVDIPIKNEKTENKTRKHTKIATNSIPLYVYEIPLLLQNYIESFYIKHFSKNKIYLKDILPRVYYTLTKLFFCRLETVLKLRNFLNSKRKAKKYIRILHKRLGIYKRKKIKFKTG